MSENSQSHIKSLLTTFIIVFIYYVFFIYKTSFLIGDLRYFCLFDDAMISMTYAKNAINGLGLNWAGFGSPVEGYTHPFWVAIMAIPHVLSFPNHLASLFMQITSMFFLFLMGYETYKLAKSLYNDFEIKTELLILTPVFLSLLYYPLIMWSLQGMESGLQAYLCIATINILWDATKNQTVPTYKFSFLLAVSLLTRMDMVFFVGLSCMYLLLVARSMPVRLIIKTVALIFFPFIAYLLFRLYYFNDPLPNTYYLKMTGSPIFIRILRGWDVSLSFLTSLAPILILSLPIFFGKTSTRKLSTFVCILTFTYFLYSIYVGGDAWEWAHPSGANRFNNFIFPPLFIFSNLGLILIIRSSLPNLFNKFSTILTYIIFLFQFIISNGMHLPAYASNNFKNISLINLPAHVADHVKLTSEVLDLNSKVTSDAIVATGWAGIVGYFGNFKKVDLHGYNDRYLARKESNVALDTSNYRKYHPGHMKWDFEYIITNYQPDLILQSADPEICRKHGYVLKEPYWTRENSKYILY